MHHDTHPRYAPGLDGVRALAVALVVGYHLGVPAFRGGFIGVSVFFTLSGYLITSLLLGELERTQRVDLTHFWIRRARRLLPASMAVLVTVVLTAAIGGSPKLGDYARQAVSASLYVANWATIARGDDYFSRFAGLGPLDHLWSLSIEEQFYLVWPLTLMLLVRAGHAIGHAHKLAKIVTGTMIVASSASMAWLFQPHAINNTRAYEGTDTRAAALLVGAFVAMQIPLAQVLAGEPLSPRRRAALDSLGLASLGIVLLFARYTDDSSAFFYCGGEFALSIATVSLVLSAARGGTLMSRALSARPLRWIGERSYGIYLWHLPVLAWLPAPFAAEPPILRPIVATLAIVLLAAASYAFVEAPVRGIAAPTRPRLLGACLFFPFAILSLALGVRQERATAVETKALREGKDEPLELPAEKPTILTGTASHGTLPGAPAPSATSAPALGSTPAATPASAGSALRTSCRKLIHLGDSTSIALDSGAFIRNPSDRLKARYRAIGIDYIVLEIDGALSVEEKLGNNKNAWERAHAHHVAGYDGCWVFALGTNDPADVRGDIAELGRRIDKMIGEAGNRPSLFLTTRTLHQKGLYRDAIMKQWNRAVLDACARHPNMRVYDWASEYKDAWFQSDKVHPNDTGAKERAARIAQALAIAFPESADSPADCVIRTAP
jgi:peptidoglycan/LPS O-acetylase OafA/YrhL